MQELDAMTDGLFGIQKHVHFYNCDRNGKLSLDSYLAWCGEIAGMQLDERGITREAMLLDRKVFLLSRHSCKCVHPASYRQDCILKTWEISIKGPQFIRGFALEDLQGKRLWESISSWVLVDPVDRKILRPTEYGHESLFCQIPLSAQLPRFRPGDAPITAEHLVTYSEIDGNGHMNNRFYGCLLTDYAPKEFLGMPLKEADISYIHEAKLEETISIHAFPVDSNAYHMYGTFPDGKKCFEARAVVDIVAANKL